MLDEALPCFFLKPSASGLKHHRDFFFSHHGSEAAPAYSLRGADPASPSIAHKNCYAAALFDSYNPDVLYGEVFARPEWTQPTLSAEELRRNGGVPPPPQPILPGDFAVQLYNPDQQIRIEVKPGTWGGSDSYEFSMPLETFRKPSSSTLDRGVSDPASLAITPKVLFAWRKESKLSKDFTCFMTGSSTDAPTKKRSKRDPDIAVALWRSVRELTIYEPNLTRLDLEDPKGLEVVLLLSAVVLKDLYLGNKDHMREVFNVTDIPSEHNLSGGGKKLSTSLPLQEPLSNTRSTLNETKRSSLPRLQTTPPAPLRQRGPPPLTDPRAQWELNAETARLQAQAEAEAREERRRRREREKVDEAEAKRLQRMVEEEDRQASRKRADVDKETERLRKLYGVQPISNARSEPQANSSSSRQRPSGPYMQPIPQRTQVNLHQSQQLPSRPKLGSNGLSANSTASSSAVMMSGANGTLSVPSKPAKKKSFFGLRTMSDDAAAEQRKKLSKKSSAMW